MNSKQTIIAKLMSSAEQFVSGEELAAACGISRNAVWKNIEALRREGYAIEARTNCGYRIVGDVLDAPSILSLVDKPLRSRLRIEAYGEVDSTNIRARALAAAGADEGLIVCASTQSAGRGRMGRSFFSPVDTGLYMSILLRPKLDAASVATNVTCAAAVAVCRAISVVFGIETGIKWVNDVYVGEKKVCGILTEAALSMESGTLDYAVLGIGVNVYEPDGGFPADIVERACALLDAPRVGARNELCAAIAREFFALYDDLASSPHLGEYRRRSIVIGRSVDVMPLGGGETRSAVVEAITDSCALVLRFPDGSLSELSSGEIRIRI